MARCSDCIFFSDLGVCRNGHVKKTEVGYFTEACSKFSNEPLKPMETKKQAAPGHAICARCGKELPQEQFARNRWGYTHYCVPCIGEMKKGKAEAKADKPAKPSRKAKATDTPPPAGGGENQWAYLPGPGNDEGHLRRAEAPGICRHHHKV